MRVLTEPKNALLKQYQELFSIEGVQLEFTPEALIAVAKKSMERKTGARGLRSILEGVLLESMYQIPSTENIEKVLVSEETINHAVAPLLISSDSKQVKEA